MPLAVSGDYSLEDLCPCRRAQPRQTFGFGPGCGVVGATAAALDNSSPAADVSLPTRITPAPRCPLLIKMLKLDFFLFLAKIEVPRFLAICEAKPF